MQKEDDGVEWGVDDKRKEKKSDDSGEEGVGEGPDIDGEAMIKRIRSDSDRQDLNSTL